MDPEIPEIEPPPPGQNPYRRAVLAVFRLIALGCFIVSGLNIEFYWLKCRRTHEAFSLLHCAWLAIPLVIGILILIKSPAWARRLTQDLDE